MKTKVIALLVSIALVLGAEAYGQVEYPEWSVVINPPPPSCSGGSFDEEQFAIYFTDIPERWLLCASDLVETQVDYNDCVHYLNSLLKRNFGKDFPGFVEPASVFNARFSVPFWCGMSVPEAESYVSACSQTVPQWEALYLACSDTVGAQLKLLRGAVAAPSECPEGGDGFGGFLWKPVSESYGSAVLLMPGNYEGIRVELVDNSGSPVAGILRDDCCANGGRQHYFFDKRGDQLPPVIARFSNGSCISIPDPSVRVD